MRFCTLSNFIYLGLISLFIIFQGGTPLKIFNYFQFKDFSESAKLYLHLSSFCLFQPGKKNYFVRFLWAEAEPKFFLIDYDNDTDMNICIESE